MSASPTRALAGVFAHPDDETFSMGAALARYAAAGVPCTLLSATDGDAGRASDVRVASRAELGATRRAELHAAARVLGVRDVWSLGLADGELPAANVCGKVTAVPSAVTTLQPLSQPSVAQVTVRAAVGGAVTTVPQAMSTSATGS